MCNAGFLGGRAISGMDLTARSPALSSEAARDQGNRRTHADLAFLNAARTDPPGIHYSLPLIARFTSKWEGRGPMGKWVL